MSERKEALEALRDDINAGKPFTVGMYMGAFPKGYSLAYKADRGSLDAAKSLHDAVLPGCRWVKYADGCFAVTGENAFGGGRDENPARAWLLAILSALISEARE